MKPNGIPVASVITKEIHVRLRDVDKDKPYLEITGHGTLAPGVVIPNEWWDRARLVDRRIELIYRGSWRDGPELDATLERIATDLRQFVRHCDRRDRVQQPYSSSSLAFVFGPHIPSTSKGGWSAWNARIARRVCGPMTPSMRPG